MEVLLDNQPLVPAVRDSEKLEALLAEVNSGMSERGRVIVSILCNGQELDTEGLQSGLQKPLSDFERVELRSQPAGDVALAVLAQSAALLEETEQNQPGIVELLNEGSTVRGMELLAGSFRLWQQAHEAVLQAIQLAGIPLDEVQVDGAPCVEIVNGLKEKLGQIKEALEARDYVMLADILQYELPDTVRRWKTLIGRLRERAGTSR